MSFKESLLDLLNLNNVIKLFGIVLCLALELKSYQHHGFFLPPLSRVIAFLNKYSAVEKINLDNLSGISERWSIDNYRAL